MSYQGNDDEKEPMFPQQSYGNSNRSRINRGQQPPQLQLQQQQQRFQQSQRIAPPSHGYANDPNNIFNGLQSQDTFTDSISMANLNYTLNSPDHNQLPSQETFGSLLPDPTGLNHLTANDTINNSDSNFLDHQDQPVHPTLTNNSSGTPFHENPFESVNTGYDPALDFALAANNSSDPNSSLYNNYQNQNQSNNFYGSNNTSMPNYGNYSTNNRNSILPNTNGLLPNTEDQIIDNFHVNIQGDSYNMQPLPTGVQFVDNNNNSIDLGNQVSGTSNPWNQGIVLSQHMGPQLAAHEQTAIQGRFELLQQNNDQQHDYMTGLLNGEDGEEEGEGIDELSLFLGNLALDCPIPTKLADKYGIANDPSKQAAEFLRMKYTAVTCEPDRFLLKRFTLRQQLFKMPRTPCHLMIVITMYNEDDILLGRTLKGVFDNLKYLCSKSPDFQNEGWKKIVVAVVSDGRNKVNPRAKALLANLGCFQDGFAKPKVLNQDVTCHLYEHTTLGNIKEVTDHHVTLDYGRSVIPTQMIFALKEKNQKKINSHRWCFQALAPALKPEVIVLFDAGTQPTKKSLYKLWNEFATSPNVGGACGEIKAMLGPAGKYLYNGLGKGLLVAGQNFEYKMSNILDKPTELMFGFISVLPGAFSAYRYEAIKNDEITGHGPLEAYFKGEFLHNNEGKHDLFENNMYLAEDRILCFEIVTKKNSNWVLRYVHSAAAATDVPDQLAEFISQRRRWLNGSFFAAVYSVVHFAKIFRSDHSFVRKFFFLFQFIYNIVNIIISWLSVGSWFLVFRILTLGVSAGKSGESMYFAAGNIIAVVFSWLYLLVTLSVFIFAFGNKPKGAQKAYWICTAIYGIMMGYMIFCSVFLSIKAVNAVIAEAKSSNTAVNALLLIKNATFRDILVSMCSTYVLYFVASALYLEPWHMFNSFIQYLLLSPMYINILSIYAFCNIHDISWGTKGSDGNEGGGGGSKGNIKKGENNKFTLDVPTTAEEVDKLFTNEQNLLTMDAQADTEVKDPESLSEEETLAIVKKEKAQKAEEKQDYYAMVRSLTVLVWVLCNGVLIAVVTDVGGVPKQKNASAENPIAGTNDQTYLTVILWLVCALAAVRFIGSALYIFGRIFRRRKVKAN